MIKHFQGVLSLALLCSFGAAAVAQQAPPSTTPQPQTPAAPDDPTQQLQQVVVTGANIPINEASPAGTSM